MHSLKPSAMRGKYGSYVRKPPALGYQPLNQELLQSVGQRKEKFSYTRQCGTSHTSCNSRTVVPNVKAVEGCTRRKYYAY
jgi:hypothetical protein